MAYIEIHEITQTLNKAFQYGCEDKIKIIKDDMRDSFAYAERDKAGGIITYKTVSSGINCTVNTAPAVSEFYREAAKVKRGEKPIKTKSGNEIIGWHCIQSFEESPAELSVEIAHEIGVKFATEMFPNFPCTVSTHCNTGNMHNHIIFGAWNSWGKKHNNCNSKYKSMRAASDRLCDEYKLSVIERTREYKLVRWVDEKGDAHYYEPTDRKNKIREGEYSNANDYRNSKSYNVGELYKKTNREVIKSDIDKLIPSVTSYEDLLDTLRGVGYEINDKKANGDWLTHVAFKAPMQDKFTRDYMIGDNGEYTREYLSDRINQLQNVLNTESQISNDSKYNIALDNNSVYEYGCINIDDLDENYRLRRANGIGNNKVVVRGNVEKLIIIDIKKLNNALNSSYATTVRQGHGPKEPVLKNEHSQYLLDRINANLKTLRFIEQKNIQSFAQINSVVSVLYDKRELATNELRKIKEVISKANESVVVINKALSLRNQIEEQKSDSNYVEFEIQSDLSILKSYEMILKQRNLTQKEQQEKFISLVKKYNNEFSRISAALKNVNEQIKDYDDCVNTINRIDREGKQKYTLDIKSYHGMREEKSGKKNASKGQWR
jgi:hypothetical protein